MILPVFAYTKERGVAPVRIGRGVIGLAVTLIAGLPGTTLWSVAMAASRSPGL